MTHFCLFLGGFVHLISTSMSSHQGKAPYVHYRRLKYAELSNQLCDALAAPPKHIHCCSWSGESKSLLVLVLREEATHSHRATEHYCQKVNILLQNLTQPAKVMLVLPEGSWWICVVPCLWSKLTFDPILLYGCPGVRLRVGIRVRVFWVLNILACPHLTQVWLEGSWWDYMWSHVCRTKLSFDHP